MSENRQPIYIAYRDDMLAQEVLLMLSAAQLITCGSIYARDMHLPEHSFVVIESKPAQKGYVVLRPNKGGISVFIRRSRNGNVERCEKMMRKIPAMVCAFEYPRMQVC